jgi:DNA-binding MarR family transcriptional regulator
MDVKPHAISTPPAPADRATRAAARRDGSDGTGGDLRAKVQQIAIRQQRFEQHLAAELNVDRAGLEAMDHLMTTGPATPTELARLLGISTAAMTLVLNRLESAGHLRRDPHPSDRRKLIITASDETSHRAYGHVAPLIQGVESLIDSLKESERVVVEKFLDGLLTAYDEVTPERSSR